MSTYIPPKHGFTDETYRVILELSKRVGELENRLRAQGSGGGKGGERVGGLSDRVSIPAASDPNAQAAVYGIGINPNVPNISISGTGVGAAFGTSPSFSMSISNASTFRGAISAAAKANPAIVAATIPLAKITGGGVDGSITVNAEGIVTAYVAPT